ncbi:MAG: asparagine synthase (glutamine-hydrolyzing) [Burkholderiales bacterium]|nr:asparagine synthase (glutamine-hydrolyzing) [Burkholderiales bacterium]
MCGIAGMVNLRPGLPPPQRQALINMAASQQHRGPDEFGLYRDAQAGLAHARLSLVDLQTGQQPMTSGHGNTWVVFNGEIYNHVALRQQLQTLGHTFRTHSDTEVILVAWQAWGQLAFERFNGQWAVALWDSDQQHLILARDPMGICPLHVCEHQGRLLFASEVKALFAAAPDMPRAFDPLGLAQTLTFWCTVSPRSVYAGVTEVHPGEVRSYRSSQVQSWQVQHMVHDNQPGSPGCFKGSLDDAAAAVGHALQRATHLRIAQADVPVGCYLSGGLDSSLLSALGRDVAGDRFQTFSLRFEDAEFDESAHQRAMVQRLGSEHHEVCVSRRDIAACFPDVIRHTERPLLRTAPAPLFMLSDLVRQHGIKAVLTGEGADEMFGGYDLFREGKVRRFWARQPASTWRHRLLERLYPYMARSPVAQRSMMKQFFGRGLELAHQPGFAHGPRWQSTAAVQRLLSPDMRAAVAGHDTVAELVAQLPGEFTTWSPLAQDQHLEIRTLLHGYLLASQGDRMLLGQSVEGRFPFLDKDVVALANSLPDAHKLHVLNEKHVLKHLGQQWVPQSIIDRPKQPYRAPDAQCFVDADAPDYVQDVLSPTGVADANVFDATLVQQLLTKCRTSKGTLSNTDNMALVAVLSTQLLHRHFIRSRPGTQPTLKLTVDVDRSPIPEAPHV